MPRVRKVVITGDVMIDWKIASGHVYEKNGPRQQPGAPPSDDRGGTRGVGTADPEAHPLFGPRVFLHRYFEAGGAALLWRIIDEASKLGPFAESTRVVSSDALRHLNRRTLKLDRYFWRAYFVAGQFRRHGDRDDVTAVWRIKEKLGIDRTGPDTFKKRLKAENYPLFLTDSEDSGDADVVVVDHLKQGFSRRRDLWPRSLNHPTKKNAYIVVRWVVPQLNEGVSEFWSTVIKRFSGRLITVVAAEHLRLYGMQISRGLSWERTVYELYERVRVLWNRRLRGCAHLVVSFFPAGAVIFSADVSKIKQNRPHDEDEKVALDVTIVHDPTHIEASWTEDFEGEMRGSTRCITAGVALEVLATAGKPDVARGVRAGLLAARHAVIEGFATTGHQQRTDTALPGAMMFPAKSVAYILASVAGAIRDGADRTNPLAPSSNEQDPDVEAAAKWLADDRARFKSHFIPRTRELTENWRLLTSWLESAKRDPLEYACEVARYGTTHTEFDFPTLRIGNLFVTDRFEIESIRDVRDLIVNYIASQAPPPVPLSIAVFGHPGSGKSFAIRELARELSSRKSWTSRVAIEEVSFNVAQFPDFVSLARALHRVRDIGLAGKIPLVFWDEFDTTLGDKPLGWLRYFLAPMQDGQFLDGTNLHNVGPAIFVFAGGTYPDMDSMNAELEEHSLGHKIGPVAAVRAKLPDFISRLQGFVDIPTLDYEDGKLKPSIALRRAELLRSFLRRAAPNLVQSVQRRRDIGTGHSETKLYQLLNIDQGVLEAFLSVQKYKYGARSMEAIVKMSTLSGKFMFDRSTLPPLDQLGLHVTAEDFVKWADRRWSPEASTLAEDSTTD